MACTRSAATPAVATASRHPIAHTGSTVRYTNAQTARTRDSRTKLSLATALLSLTHALSAKICCTNFCHQLHCKPASRTQHSTTSLHLLHPDADLAPALRSPLHFCTMHHTTTACQHDTMHCCQAAMHLFGRSSVDRSPHTQKSRAG